MWVNGLVVAVGVAVTAGTYLASAPGGSFVVAWGAILFGGLRLLRAMRPPEPTPDPPGVVLLTAAPRRLSVWKPAAVALVCLALGFGCAGPELYRTAQVYGDLPGGVVTREVVRQKAVQHWDNDSVGGDYWVWWGESHPASGLVEKERVSKEAFDRAAVGETVEVARAPGSPHGLVRGSLRERWEYAFLELAAVALFGVPAAAGGLIALRRWCQPRTP